jgi:probable HAF family extracellular repeat protein
VFLLQGIRLVSLAACIGTFAWLTLGTASAASIYDLGVLPGRLGSDAFGVSSDGSVVVGYSAGAGGSQFHAFRWTASSGAMQDLGVLPNAARFSVATDVSDDGAAVVGYSGDRNTRAFRWTMSDGMQDLGSLGGEVTTARGTNKDGSVVVGSASYLAGSRAFRWTSSSAVMQNLGTLPGGTFSSAAHAVSADGSVVVGSSDTYGSSTHAFRWTASGGMQDLGTMDVRNSYASGVSSDGSVVIGGRHLYGNVYHAFRWTMTEGMQDLGTIDGLNSHASGVSADGSVVVGYCYDTTVRAMLWTPTLGMRYLDTYLSSLGVNLEGWTLGNAAAISADGSAIVGGGFYEGEGRAFLVTGLPTVPEIDPNSLGSVLALVLGSLGLLERRRLKTA